MIDQPPSLSPTPPDDLQRTERIAARRRPLWMVYVLAALLPLATLLVRLAMGFTAGDPPLLILFTFPIVVSAYVGGLGPGLLATVLATLLSSYALLPPQYAFSLTTRLTLLQSGGLLGAGILISVLSEELHRARVQAETDQRLQALTLTTIGDGVIITDTHGRITFLNPKAERLTGWSCAEAIGQPLAAVVRLINAHTRAPIDDLVTKVLSSGALAGPATHTLLIGSDGRETLIDHSGAPITTVDAIVQGVVLAFRDVTGRERAEAALRESQARLAGIVGAAMDAIISTDAAQRIVVFNTAAEQMFDCPAAAAIGQPLDRFVPARFRSVHAAHIQAFGQTGITSRSMHSPGTLTALRADGTEFPIEATLAQTVAAAQPLYTVIMRDISARIHAEVALHESEQRYRQIVETAQEGMWQIDASNRTTFVNARMAAMLGYAVDELIGASLFDFMDADGQASAAAHIKRRRQGIAEQYDFKFRRKDGGDVWALISTNPVLDRAGTYAGTLAMVTDITARKRDEQALRQSEARFATAFRASPVAMSITRLHDGHYIDVNTSHERLFGYARDELVGQSADGISIYADPNQRAEVVRIISAHGSLRETELTLRTKSGELREVLCSLATIEVDGEACILGSVFDITARKHAEAALRASEERFRQAFVSNPSPELITRVDNRAIVDANPAFARMTGYARDELVGQTTDALGLWPESKVITQTRAHLRHAGAVTNREIPIRTRDGSIRELLLSVVPVDLDGVAGFLTVMLDQTERKHAEVARGRAADRLRVLADASAAFAEMGTAYQPLLNRVAQTTATVLGEGCTIRVLSDDAAWLYLAALYDGDPEKRELTRTILGAAPLRVDEPALAAQVFQQRQALLISVVDPAQLRAATKPEYRSLIDGLELRSLMFVPMRMHGRAIGVVTLYRRERERPPFDEDDLTLAQDLADRAALAIENARLLGQLQHELAERTSTEAALRDSETWARSLFQSAAVGIVVVGLDGRIVEANLAMTQFLGWSVDEFSGMPVSEITHPDEAAEARMLFEQLLDTTIAYATAERRYRHKDGTTRWGLVRASLLLGAAGDVRAIIGAVADITDRKRAEQALHRSTDRLRVLASASRLFAEASSEDDGLFERIARTIAESLHDFCGIRMLSADGQWLNTVALYNATATPLDSLQTTMAARPVPVAAIPSLRSTIQGDQALLMPALDPAQIQSTLLDSEDRPNLQQINDYDRVVAPLRVGGQPIGVIGVTHKRSSNSPYDEDDLRLVQDLADRAALAISNARLYQQLQQSHTALEARVAARTTELADANATLQRQALQASALANMSRALAEAGRDLQPLFDTIVQHVAMLMGDTCVLSMLSADRQWMQPVASHNADTQRNVLIRSLLAGAPNRADAGWSAPLVATGQPLLLPHVPAADMRAQLDPRYHPYLQTVDALSLLIVPVRAHGTLLGMLTALRDRPDPPYTVDDQALLQDLADRAGLAIENARLFAEVEQARTEAEQANAAKDAFLASMSHELRTPLNAILGFTGTLLMKLPGPLTADQEKQLTIVQRSGKHLLNLINDILDLAKIESGKVELRSTPVVCQAVIDEVMTTLRPLAEQKGLRYTVVVPAEPVVTPSDQRVLSQILINLINNAIKFTDHGEVQIALAREAIDGQGRVTLRVMDTGIGITAEDQAKLFQEFGRVNSDAVRAREGTGLGLRLSRKLAELLGGTITLTSELGSGSTFTLVLPDG